MLKKKDVVVTDDRGGLKDNIVRKIDSAQGQKRVNITHTYLNDGETKDPIGDYIKEVSCLKLDLDQEFPQTKQDDNSPAASTRINTSRIEENQFNFSHQQEIDKNNIELQDRKNSVSHASKNVTRTHSNTEFNDTTVNQGFCWINNHQIKLIEYTKEDIIKREKSSKYESLKSNFEIALD